MGLAGDYIVGEQSHFRVLKCRRKGYQMHFACRSLSFPTLMHVRNAAASVVTKSLCSARHAKRSSLSYDLATLHRSHVKHELRHVEPRPWMCGDKRFAPYAARRSCLYRLSGFAPRASLFNVFLFKWERLSVSHDFSTRASGEEL